jgi:hypothetical protein
MISPVFNGCIKIISVFENVPVALLVVRTMSFSEHKASKYKEIEKTKQNKNKNKPHSAYI